MIAAGICLRSNRMDPSSDVDEQIAVGVRHDAQIAFRLESNSGTRTPKFAATSAFPPATPAAGCIRAGSQGSAYRRPSAARRATGDLQRLQPLDRVLSSPHPGGASDTAGRLPTPFCFAAFDAPLGLRSLSRSQGQAAGGEVVYHARPAGLRGRTRKKMQSGRSLMPLRCPRRESNRILRLGGASE